MISPRPLRYGRSLHGAHTRRKGAAALEFAIVAPVLMLLVFGAVDTGQLINVSQTVSNASREGARLAARNTTLNTSEVDTAVASYVTDIHPSLSASSIEVTVTDGAGVPISGGDLTTIAVGSPISVEVEVEYDSVRWFSGLVQLDGTEISETTVMRRE